MLPILRWPRPPMHEERSMPRFSLPTLIAAVLILSSAAPSLATTESTESLRQESARDAQGFLFGRIESRDGTFEGRIRWGDEEAFWDDHLNGYLNRRPHIDEVPADQQGERLPVTIFGIKVGSRWEAWESSRSLVARFGDIAGIERRGRRHILLMKSGSEVELRGGSNDLRGDLTIWDATRGEQTLDMREVNKITFLPVPEDLDVAVHRVYGTVLTEAGSFEGFVQWDLEECLSTDLIDGDDPGGERQKIPLGDIRRIARRTNSSSELTLADGTTLVLDGTNDVNGANRGIVVEDTRFGRVEIPWSAFDRVDFQPARNNGRGYDDFGPGRTLRGTVVDASGRSLTGEIVYDIDEAETWAMLNGDADSVEYNIPFSLIRSIEPRDESSSRIVFHDGTRLELSDSVDVGDGNAGVLVRSDRGSTYVPWDEVRTISFEASKQTPAGTR